MRKDIYITRLQKNGPDIRPRPAIKVVTRRVSDGLTGCEVVGEHVPYESKSNGEVERAVQTVHSLARTLKVDFEWKHCLVRTSSTRRKSCDRAGYPSVPCFVSDRTYCQCLGTDSRRPRRRHAIPPTRVTWWVSLPCRLAKTVAARWTSERLIGVK